MKKFLGAGLLVVAVFWIGTDTIGQERKARSTAKAGTIEIIESRDGKFRFTVRDAEGKYVGGSAVGHASDKEAREAVDELRQALAGAKFVSKKAEAREKDKDKDKDE